jgi:hypothetical protein
MKHIVWKAYYNYEKEEKWLNQMSAKGLAMTDYSWCRYVFEEAPNNEYIYRLELLNQLPSHPESRAYLRFLEESGVEHIASYMRWVYLRKKTIEGPFDLYTDIDSRIQHYQRILLLWNVLMMVELSIGAVYLIHFATNYFQEGTLDWIRLIGGLFFAALGFFFFKLGSPHRKQVKQLRQERNLRE